LALIFHISGSIINALKSGGFTQRTASRVIPSITKYAWNTGASSSAAPNPGGRKRGFRLVSDAKLKEMLEPYVSDSCRWSARHNDTFKVLNASIVAVARAIGMPYRTLARRLANGKLGISPAMCRTDVCEYCDQWDQTELPRITQSLQTFRERASLLEPGFFDTWDEEVAASEAWSASDFVKEASQSYLTAFSEYLEKFCDLADGPSPALLDLCGTFVRGLPPVIELVGGYLAHWRLRDNQKQQHAVDRVAPKQATLYVQSDFQEPHCSHLQCSPVCFVDLVCHVLACHVLACSLRGNNNINNNHNNNHNNNNHNNNNHNNNNHNRNDYNIYNFNNDKHSNNENTTRQRKHLQRANTKQHEQHRQRSSQPSKQQA
jgi:hypothetical protein